MATEISFMRKVAKRGKSGLMITVPAEHKDLFPAGKRVKVTRLEES